MFRSQGKNDGAATAKRSYRGVLTALKLKHFAEDTRLDGHMLVVFWGAEGVVFGAPEAFPPYEAMAAWARDVA